MPDDVLPREEQGTRDGRKITVKETGTGAGMSTRVVIKVRTGAGTGAGMWERTGTIVEIRVQESRFSSCRPRQYRKHQRSR